MSRHWPVLLSVPIVLGLVVPGVLVNTPSVTGTRMGEAAAPAAGLAAPASRPEGDRDRADEDRGDEELGATRVDRLNAADHGGSGQHRVGSAENFCGGLQSVKLPEME